MKVLDLNQFLSEAAKQTKNYEFENTGFVLFLIPPTKLEFTKLFAKYGAAFEQYKIFNDPDASIAKKFDLIQNAYDFVNESLPLMFERWEGLTVGRLKALTGLQVPNQPEEALIESDIKKEAIKTLGFIAEKDMKFNAWLMNSLLSAALSNEIALAEQKKI